MTLKRLKKWGPGAGVYWSNGELEDRNMGIGDLIDIDDSAIKKKKKVKNEKKKKL